MQLIGVLQRSILNRHPLLRLSCQRLTTDMVSLLLEKWQRMLNVTSLLASLLVLSLSLSCVCYLALQSSKWLAFMLVLVLVVFALKPSRD